MELRRTSRHSARRSPQQSAAYRTMTVRLALVAVGVAAAAVAINSVAGSPEPNATIGGWATVYPGGSISGPSFDTGSPYPEASTVATPWPSAVPLLPITGGGPVPGAASDSPTTRATGPSPTGAPPAAPTTPRSPKPSKPRETTPARYPTIQAEDFDGQRGVRTESRDGGAHIGYISTGDWVRYDDVNFTGDAARSLLIRASNAARQNRSGRVELRLDRRSNPPVGAMTIPNNGDWFEFSTYRMGIPATTGVHTVYLTFTSNQDEEFANVDWLRLEH